MKLTKENQEYHHFASKPGQQAQNSNGGGKTYHHTPPLQGSQELSLFSLTQKAGYHTQSNTHTHREEDDIYFGSLALIDI